MGLLTTANTGCTWVVEGYALLLLLSMLLLLLLLHISPHLCIVDTAITIRICL